jgi:uncharacterized protein YgbK (DUF1537 family)
LQDAGVGVAIVDAIEDGDLVAMGSALKDMPLVTGGSGVAIGLPANWGLQGSSAAGRRADQLPEPRGMQAIVSGSCSQATNTQVLRFKQGGGPAFAVDPLAIAAGEDVAARAMAWALPLLAQGPVLVYATAQAEAVQAVQSTLGAARAGELVEQTLSRIATGLVQAGVRQLVVAGGETSGAVVQALGVSHMQIGPQIDPGVPWTSAAARATDGEPMHLALKSGNFGGDEFFTDAFRRLRCTP